MKRGYSRDDDLTIPDDCSGLYEYVDACEMDDMKDLKMDSAANHSPLHSLGLNLPGSCRYGV